MAYLRLFGAIGFLAAATTSAHAYNYDSDFLLGSHELGSIGFYSSGCLDSEAKITGGEAGLLKLFIERDRRYGNPMMVELLSSLGLAYQHDWQQYGEPAEPYERIQLGDIAQKGGGRISKHASHQTGLDVDIVYMRRDHRETKVDRGFDASFDEFFVHGKRVSANLDDVRQWWVWRWLYRTGKVDRIFLDKQLKRHFCQRAARLEPDDTAERDAILRLLRPYPEHADHFHMRLVCPAADPKCVGQAPVPPGPGCTDREIDNESGEMTGHARAPRSQGIFQDEALPGMPDEDRPTPSGGVAHHAGPHTLPRECRHH